MFTPLLASIAMVLVVTTSNYLVQFPINDWLTWGAIPYPLSYLVTELTSWYHGKKAAKKIVYLGFGIATLFSLFFATPKIAFASSFAFLLSQLLDLSLFSLLIDKKWWKAPFLASILASTIDTFFFWSLAFFGENLPIFTWAIGDLAVKIAIDTALLVPFRILYRPLFIKV